MNSLSKMFNKVDDIDFLMVEGLRKEARQKAAAYLEKHPRQELYPVNLLSTEDDSEGTYCHVLSADEKALIQTWCDQQEGDEYYGTLLDEFLGFENEALRDRLADNDSIFPLNLVASCNLKDPRKYAIFEYYNVQLAKGQVEQGKQISVPLTDEEYIQVLAELILNPALTMNEFASNLPEIFGKVMKHIVNTSPNELVSNPFPFVITFGELEEAAKEVLKK